MILVAIRLLNIRHCDYITFNIMILFCKPTFSSITLDLSVAIVGV